MLKFIKYAFLTILGVTISFISAFLTLAVVSGVVAVKDNGWTIGSENYVSDDFETLYIDGIEYQRFEVPFEVCGTRWQISKYYTNFAEWKNMHGSIYIESVSKRYPFVWWSDIDYVLGEYALSENITIMQLTNEYTNESYNYCLPEHISVVADIVNNVTWEQNLTFAVQLDEYEDATIGARTEKMSPEFSSYILESREKLSSVASSYMDVKMNIVNSNTDIAIYQYDDNMNFRKRLFVIRKTDDGSFLLYDEICMFLGSTTPNATLEDYGYLLLPENLENELVSAFTAIGANATAAICQKAISAFGRDIPIDRDEREEMLDELEGDEIDEILDECDSAFCDYEDDLNQLNYNFVMKNKESFT